MLKKELHLRVNPYLWKLFCDRLEGVEKPAKALERLIEGFLEANS